MTRRHDAGRLLDGSELDRREGAPRGILRRHVPKDTAIKAISITVLASLLASGIAWAAGRINTTKLDTDRFVLDSAHRDAIRLVDSLGRASDRDILRRLDSRVGEIYCARIPADERDGCR